MSWDWWLTIVVGLLCAWMVLALITGSTRW